MKNNKKIVWIRMIIAVFLFFTYTPKHYMVYAEQNRGIDVSFWQGKIDWGKVKNSGISFAMIREGYGTRSGGKVDRMFHQNIKEAQKSGIKCGVYHYSYAKSVQEAYEEADFCLDNIKGYKLDYPVAFDIEDKSMRGLSRRTLTDICKAFCGRVRERGYYPMIYTNVDWFRNILYREELRGYDMWLARWKSSYPGYRCEMWQHTDSGRVSGIRGNVDLDIGYIDYSSVIKNLRLNGF